MTVTHIDSAEPIGGLAGWAVQLMESLGGPGAAVVVGLDNLFPPIPSELVLPLAGFTASQGTFSLAGALFWTTLGSVLGALVTYYLGAWLGPTRVRALFGGVPLLRPADFDRAEAWFHRHGAKAVFLGRMVPLFRSVISLPAGVSRMRMRVFLPLTLLGSLLWNAIFVVAGYLLGESWHVVQDYAGVAQKVVIGLVVLAVAGFVVSRLRGRGGDGRHGHDPAPRRQVRNGPRTS
ncbi:membrane protein DedA, SNARE-associated domain [Amycolatopsis arida]|uniref:Membrane protein DedA, SNARE-associated domain n=1 Tax=Amycolatopsis arida TaxID=587909 RepID=A0A1I6A5H8_9PSEU|nr:DedA family protein [Amycolatopsis arida]TDX88603.1 membrane protein DedA with SNARE-associated domain [Amycolatopsis arida]SFQ63883.1 membrane protein DedA, SNARE-associated domain [Amycolatopsis arida]